MQSSEKREKLHYNLLLSFPWPHDQINLTNHLTIAALTAQIGIFGKEVKVITKKQSTLLSILHTYIKKWGHICYLLIYVVHSSVNNSRIDLYNLFFNPVFSKCRALPSLFSLLCWLFLPLFVLIWSDWYCCCGGEKRREHKWKKVLIFALKMLIRQNTEWKSFF